MLLGVLAWPTAPAFYSIVGSTGQFGIGVTGVVGDFLTKPGRRRKRAGLVSDYRKFSFGFHGGLRVTGYRLQVAGVWTA